MNKDVNPCRGCVCYTCTKSAAQGNTYGCNRRRCSQCEDEFVVIKLSYCDDVEPIAEGGDLFVCE